MEFNSGFKGLKENRNNTKMEIRCYFIHIRS